MECALLVKKRQNVFVALNKTNMQFSIQNTMQQLSSMQSDYGKVKFNRLVE